MKLYHVGYYEIKEVDLKHGRKNADFGQGFYLSNNLEFSKNWASIRENLDTVLNCYELDINGLNVLEFKENNEDWFNYIFKNRNGYEDIYKDYDVIIGPIANDTIFDLYGIITSGLIDNKMALNILKEGPKYYQIVIKTERAKANLKFLNSIILDKNEILNNRNIKVEDERKYQQLMFSKVNKKVKNILS